MFDDALKSVPIAEIEKALTKVFTEFAKEERTVEIKAVAFESKDPRTQGKDCFEFKALVLGKNVFDKWLNTKEVKDAPPETE